MLKQHRWKIIVDLCGQNGSMDIHSLVESIGVSEATIRRDLQQMEELNMITRYHGGATINLDQSVEPPMALKFETNVGSKNKVARLAASLIKDNQMIYIDAGSSTFEMLDYITAKNISVVTNGIPHIDKLKSNKIRTIIVLGGIVRWSTQATIGSYAVKQLDDLYFDVAFVGVNGIHKHVGFTTTNEQEAEIKAKVISHSTVSYLLADNSKFNKLSPVKYASLDQAIIISDKITDFDHSLIKYILV